VAREVQPDASDIIFKFLADYKSVDFVMTMLVESDRMAAQAQIICG